MAGTMHTALGSVIVSMHEERSRPPHRHTNHELSWVDELIIQVFDHKTLEMYDLSAQDAYYRLYERCSPPSTEKVYLRTYVFSLYIVK